MAFDTNYPFTSYNFDVEFLDTKLIVGRFSEVSGLDFTTEVEEYREGGLNEYTHKLPTITKYQNLVLKRGMTYSTYLFDWYKDVLQGNIVKRGISVVLLDSQRNEVKKWAFTGAFPIKWSTGNLNAMGNSIAVESCEIVHRGLVL